jgi:DNA-directed RNA polymerase subunit beta
MGELPADDRQWHLRHQRHGAGHRVPAAPVPGRVFRSRQGQDPFSSGKLLVQCRIIPYRGSWLDFEFDAKDCVFVRIDRRRKLPATVLLRALGMDTEEILSTFFEFNSVHLLPQGAELELIADRLRGENAVVDILDGDRVIVKAGRRITPRHIREIEKAGIRALMVPDDYIDRAHAGPQHRRPGNRRGASRRRMP